MTTITQNLVYAPTTASCVVDTTCSDCEFTYLTNCNNRYVYMVPCRELVVEIPLGCIDEVTDRAFSDLTEMEVTFWYENVDGQRIDVARHLLSAPDAGVAFANAGLGLATMTLANTVTENYPGGSMWMEVWVTDATNGTKYRGRTPVLSVTPDYAIPYIVVTGINGIGDAFDWDATTKLLTLYLHESDSRHSTKGFETFVISNDAGIASTTINIAGADLTTANATATLDFSTISGQDVTITITGTLENDVADPCDPELENEAQFAICIE